jgi:glutamyl-tRNA(Gln) amidotransferase subunit E
MDYQKAGLKCGIEIHQQIDTSKLFCRCGSSMSDAARGEIVRRLRAVAGELGDIDPAALHEVTKGRRFLYKLYPNESCLVEMDEEPPGPVNQEALETSLTVSAMLGCEIPDEIQVMRKTVIDGSNTTGFQRTAMAGIDGRLMTSQGEVGITNICLEEEASQILGSDGGSAVYGLNRLCIPLVEIGTAPDIRSPEHAKETAERLGMILRSTGRVKRGIGTIRQDINISIRGGARIEVKGAQELRLISRLVEHEVSRQWKILEISERVKDVKVRPRAVDVTGIFRDHESSITKGKSIFAMDIPGFRGFLRERLTPTQTLGNEIAGYVKARIGAKGFIHNDEDLEKYGMGKHFGGLARKLKAREGDTIIIVAGDREHAEKTFRSIAERIESFKRGVPEETRRALDNGDTEYLRPLPGADRLYPETDIPPIRITPAMLRDIRKNLPEMLDDTVKRLQNEYRLGAEISRQVVMSGRSLLFERAVKAGVDPKTAASVLTSMLTSLRREGVPVDRLSEEELLEIFSFLGRNRLTKEGISSLLRARAGSPGRSLRELAAGKGKRALSSPELQKAIRKVISGHRELLKRDRPEKALMGLVMKELGGRASGREVMQALVRELKRKGKPGRKQGKA